MRRKRIRPVVGILPVCEPGGKERRFVRQESTATGADPRLVIGADGRARFPLGSQYLPTSYGLRARRS